MKLYKIVKEKDSWHVVRCNDNKVMSIFINDSYDNPEQSAKYEARRLSMEEKDKEYEACCNNIQDAIYAATELKRWLSNLLYRMETDDVYDGQIQQQYNNINSTAAELAEYICKIPFPVNLVKARESHISLLEEEAE